VEIPAILTPCTGDIDPPNILEGFNVQE
jgi:hypothetical protein